QFLVERIPPAVGERRFLPPAARGIRVQVAADEAELLHAALELRYAVGGRHAGGLRQLTHRREVRRVEAADAVDQVVALAGPGDAGRLVADVVLHRARARREEGQAGAALALDPELGAFERVANLLIGNDRCRNGFTRIGKLQLSPIPQSFRRRRIVPVAVDDHAVSMYGHDTA